MRKMKVPFSILLVLCMLLSFAPFRSQASAAPPDRRPPEKPHDGEYWDNWGQWYQVAFTTVRVPVDSGSTGTASTTASGTAATPAGSTTRLVDTNFSYYFNEWAKTLIVRGTGDMPAFSKEHPAPWANLKDKAVRVILERNITSISANAFVDFMKLRSVVLPMTLKAIDPEAFSWSEEVKNSKQYQKLERLEFSGNLDDLDKVLDNCTIQELLDARIVKVTEQAIQNEIWQLTWYRVQPRIKVKYDKAGRPVRIREVTPDGYAFDTTIKYTNEAEIEVKSRDEGVTSREIVEKRETNSLLPDGSKVRYNREINDLGQQNYFSMETLNDAGRPVSGTDYYATNWGVQKTGKMSVSYNADGSSTRTSNYTYTGGSLTQQVIESVDASGRILSVQTTSYDPDGSAYEISKEENSYRNDGKLASKTNSTSSPDGSYSKKETTEYSYNNAGQLVSSATSGSDSFGNAVSASSNYKYDSNGNLHSYSTTKTEYGYKYNCKSIF